MSQMSIAQALELAGRHHEAGNLAQAEALYRQILAADPKNAQALHLLGFLAMQAGKYTVAVDLIEQSLRVDRHNAEAWAHLGHCLQQLKRWPETVAAYQRSLALAPRVPEILSALGIVFHAVGQTGDAVTCYQEAILLKPGFVDPVHNLGLIWAEQGHWEEAMACYRRTLELAPNLAEAHNNLALALRAVGRMPEAVEHFRRALALRPDFADALNNLGSAMWDQGQNLEEALRHLQRAVALAPSLAQAHCNLGTAILGMGQPEEAAKSFQRAIELQLADAALHSRFLFSLIFNGEYDGPRTRQANHEWYLRHAQKFQSTISSLPNGRDPDRRLRIGYVSPHFHEHCQSFFTTPLLAHHDHKQFEVFCYSLAANEDAVMARLRSCADVWRPIGGLNDDQAAALIRQDKIDILIDLAMHMDRNRILIFARKPAPVQITWLAYPGTTGLATMDYRITDPYLDPPGEHDDWYVEKSLRLPETFWCYDPLVTDISIAPLPASTAGHITFGCLNNFAKVNVFTLKLWSQVLKAVPGSHLIFLVDPGAHRDKALALLQAQEIAGERIRTVGRMSRRDYLSAYQQMDICLDTFPCPGHTTTFDALWMGVPVVALPSQTAVGRGGLSILKNAGLPELIARTPEDFVRISKELAGDVARLGELRRKLRERMEKSPLMDARRFAQNMEAAYRATWRSYCGSK